MVDANSSLGDLRDIANLYQQVDNYLESLQDEEELADNNTTNGNGAIFRKQRINDQAYFVLAWGQLEVGINAACRNVIRIGQSQCDWGNRRVWTLHNLNVCRLSRLSFQNRLTLVLERESEHWRQTLEFYQLRNQVAHGDFLPERIDVVEVIQVFFEILGSLASE